MGGRKGDSKVRKEQAPLISPQRLNMSEVGDWCDYNWSKWQTKLTETVVNGYADQRLVTPVVSAALSKDLLRRGGTRKSIFFTV